MCDHQPASTAVSLGELLSGVLPRAQVFDGGAVLGVEWVTRCACLMGHTVCVSDGSHGKAPELNWDLKLKISCYDQVRFSPVAVDLFLPCRLRSVSSPDQRILPFSSLFSAIDDQFCFLSVLFPCSLSSHTRRATA
eukprot:1349537-Rhodomonas_salina.1